MKTNSHFLALILLIILLNSYNAIGQVVIKNQPANKVIAFGNSQLMFTLDYNQRCVVTKLEVGGEPVVSTNGGIYSEVRTALATYSTKKLTDAPTLVTTKNQVTVSNIRYGDKDVSFNETWKFDITQSDIQFTIERAVNKPVEVEEVAFPSINFNSFKTWNGAFLEYGGLAWFYLFNEKLCTYGVHSGYSAFWNSTTGNGLKVTAASPGKQVSSKFSRTSEDGLNYAISVSDREMKFRYDPDTKRRRFIRQKTDVFDSFLLTAGKYSETVTFSPMDYNKEFGRGNLVGIDGKQVTNLLNTIARIGVIDAKLFGGNSWHTPYGPICLHEQYIGQIGIAVNDNNYLKGYMQCLDYYRDNAIRPDGRVLSRWAYDDSDAMKGTATPQGFYEAQWGYLFDSNPDFVTNVSELYNQCGDLNWVRNQKAACEKSLDYLLKRDTNGNHLVEMMNTDHSQRKGSDWIDIIWASWENAFNNAKLYYALTLWSAIERQLGDSEKSTYYSNYAAALKVSFNKPTSEGGFWDEKNKWYVHWLDKDGSVHGNNLVVPVNFMAIAYGICDNELNKKAILDRVEDQMQKEKLFAWPLCMYSYEIGEGNDWQFPFPNYENGDIFLSWGSVGVKAYAAYQPDLALKYIENILSRYEKDGLAFQRYGRLKQDGLGDDILSGNCLALVGLYVSVYGVNPMYNRLYLNPHLPDKLSGTELNYNFRGDRLKIKLEKGRYSISNQQYKVTATHDFGFNSAKDGLEYFVSNGDQWSLKAQISKTNSLALEMTKCTENEVGFKQIASANSKVTYSVSNLLPDHQFTIFSNNQILRTLKSDKKGSLSFDVNATPQQSEILIK
jgi:hypothetical protein